MLKDTRISLNYEDVLKIEGQKILIAPLNWGLGHATRCLPIIDELSVRNELIIGSDGLALEWIQHQRPALSYVTLPSYTFRYDSSRMWLNALRFGPNVISAIRQETEIIKEIVDQKNIDLIISDHRLGLYHGHVPSILIAHQLRIPFGTAFISKLVSKFQARYINRFNRCWIPDYNSSRRLSGTLSDLKLNIEKEYIGPLSRCRRLSKPKKKYDVAIFLSGPEPARTTLEKKLAKLRSWAHLKIILVRGTNILRSPEVWEAASHMEVIDLADAEMSNRFLNESAIIISRSGYSTIMDLDSLEKKAILIPTPGQPEQLYLAKYHQDRWPFVHQEEIGTGRIEHMIHSLSK